MLIGGDVSHWNYPFEVGFAEFQIFKATEGASYIDPRFFEYIKNVDWTEPVGVYHFIRVDNRYRGNTPQKEAENFVNTILKAGILGKVMLICDFEGASVSVKDSENYVLTFLSTVEVMTGIKPIIYVSASVAKKLKRIKNAGYELWVAHYNVKAPDSGCWDKWLMWQFTSLPFDLNLFNGTVKDWNDRCVPRTYV